MSNLTAFLDTISYSEGTYDVGDDGYNVLVGGGLFTDYNDHPRQRIWLPKLGVYSTAAGRYQILARFYDAYKKMLDLPDFSPASQDAIATQMIKEHGGLSLLAEGNFDGACLRCATVWASFPGAGYGQHENSIVALRAFYMKQGGIVAPEYSA